MSSLVVLLSALLESLGDSVLSVLVRESAEGDPLSALGVLEDLGGSSLDDLSSGLLVAGLHLSLGLGDDGGVNLLVEVFAGLGFVGGEALVPLRE